MVNIRSGATTGEVRGLWKSGLEKYKSSCGWSNSRTAGPPDSQHFLPWMRPACPENCIDDDGDDDGGDGGDDGGDGDDDDDDDGDDDDYDDYGGGDRKDWR